MGGQRSGEEMFQVKGTTHVKGQKYVAAGQA